jgi:hypothetical protein
MRAFGSEELCGGKADAAGGTCDNGNLAVEPV